MTKNLEGGSHIHITLRFFEITGLFRDQQHKKTYNKPSSHSLTGHVKSSPLHVACKMDRAVYSYFQNSVSLFLDNVYEFRVCNLGKEVVPPMTTVRFRR